MSQRVRTPLDDALRTAGATARSVRLFWGYLCRRHIHCTVQVSNRCNLTCGFCSFWERPAPPRDEMVLSDFVVIAAKLAEGGAMVVSLEGGEPLLRPDIRGIVAAFARDHHPILFTNGWPVTPALARGLWDAGLTRIGVSVDYAVPEQHDAHRGRGGTHAAALRAVEVLRDTAPRGGRQVGLISVLMHDNTDQIEELLALAAARGVGYQVTLLSVSGGGRHSRAQRMPEAGVGARLLGLKRRYPNFLTFSGYLEAVDGYLRGQVRTPCWAGERFLNVDHLGEVSPCIEKLHLSAGNLRRDPWSVVAERLRAFDEVRGCTGCMTACRGFVEEMSGTPRLGSYAELRGY